MLKFYFFVAASGYVLRDQYLTNYIIGKKLGIHSNSKVWVEKTLSTTFYGILHNNLNFNPKLAMMATMMQDKTANPINFLPFLYKADDSDNISLEALFLFNYIYEHGNS